MSAANLSRFVPISVRRFLLPSLIRSWTPTLSAWGGTALIALVYFADWKVVLRKIPFVRGRFPVESSGVVEDKGSEGDGGEGEE